jgi:predicted Zn-dependent protease with MMP-like domain
LFLFGIILQISIEEFHEIIDAALESLPGEHVKNIKNVAILYEEEPSAAQREQFHLRDDQTLFGLYEGIPLSQRQGTTPLLPDKITLFKGPLERGSRDLPDLNERVRHTLWHEIAHYYGLNHSQIHDLE